MQVKDWLIGLEKHTEPLAAFFKKITNSEVEISIADVDSKGVEEAAELLNKDEIVVRAIEQQFQTEVFVGFSSGALLPLIRSINGEDQDVTDTISETIILTITEKLFEQLASTLHVAKIQMNISEFEPIAAEEVSGSFNQHQYLIAQFAVKGSFGEFTFSLAVGEPNKANMEAVVEEWGDANPFEASEFLEKAIGIFGNVSFDFGNSAGEESKVQVKGQTVEFEAFDKRNVVENDREITNIDMLRDVEMGLSVELGRREMPLGKILQLVKGSVIELERMAGEPVDILVNGHSIATGDVVVIDDYFGVRITQLHEENFNFKAV